VVADEVQHAEQQHRDRLPEIDAAGQGVVAENRVRVVVDVGDPRAGDDLAGDLVHVRRGGQAATQVEVLRDALLGEEAHRAKQERAVGQGQPPRLQPGFHQPLGGGPVDGEVVLPVEQVVVDPGDARTADVDALRDPGLVGPGDHALRRQEPALRCNRLQQTLHHSSSDRR
jgi:hypothetical protein